MITVQNPSSFQRLKRPLKEYSICFLLVGKYRTFEVDHENLYDFMKNQLQESYSCIFEFDTLQRKVNVRDANQSARKTPVFLSKQNLAKEIEIEEDTENICTVLDVNGADACFPVSLLQTD